MTQPQFPPGFGPEDVLQQHPEATLPVEQRLQIAEQRALELNKFSVIQDAVRHHEANIRHLLVEDKYNQILPCTASSNMTSTFAWAPYVGEYSSHLLRESKLVQAIHSGIENGEKLTNITSNIPGTQERIRVFNGIPRNIVEYNPAFVQLCVVAVITNKNRDRFLLLETPSTSPGRVKGQTTFVQGHVEIREDVNFKPAYKYLNSEATREICEETSISASDIDSGDFIEVYYDNRTQLTAEHISVLYEFEVSDEILDEVISKEPESHKVLVLTRQEVEAKLNTDNIVDYYFNKNK